MAGYPHRLFHRRALLSSLYHHHTTCCVCVETIFTRSARPTRGVLTQRDISLERPRPWLRRGIEPVRYCVQGEV